MNLPFYDWMLMRQGGEVCPVCNGAGSHEEKEQPRTLTACYACMATGLLNTKRTFEDLCALLEERTE